MRRCQEPRAELGPYPAEAAAPQDAHPGPEPCTACVSLTTRIGYVVIKAITGDDVRGHERLTRIRSSNHLQKVVIKKVKLYCENQ